MEKYTIQIRATLVVSKEVRAENMQDALKIAETTQSQDMVKPQRGCTCEWDEEPEVVAVLS